VKRRQLIRHLEQQGCELLREGANHSVYVNRAAGKTSTVPRHSEVNDHLARKICKDLNILAPQSQHDLASLSWRLGGQLRHTPDDTSRSILEPLNNSLPRIL